MKGLLEGLFAAHPVVLPLISATAAMLGGWHLARCCRRERIFFNGWYARASDPFSFWLSIGALAIVTVGFAVLALVSVLADSLGL